MNNLTRILIYCSVVVGGALSTHAANLKVQAFPSATAESVGLPPKAMEMLAERVQAMVDNEEIVGGELLVIKNRRTVFREAYGWMDREAETPLAVDAVYCVRSMTKPFVGTAIQMLIDEGKLSLDTPVHKILPFFAGPETGKITVKHLLTHTGGFPFTTLGKPLADYKDLAEVAAEAAASGVGFEPGTRFEYSDAGSDTLGAIVAKITGEPVEQFIQQRILDPLGMKETLTLLGDKNQFKARIPSAYSGGTGSWSKHWSPTDEPIFPIFLTSQSLYSTTTDYARFLALWMDGGRAGDKQLLSSEAIDRGLTPNEPMSNYPKTIKGVQVSYGQQWMVYGERTTFGHGGSDGTHAWAWPEQDLMVLFFTQSRGTLAGLGLESVLQTLLVDQKLDDESLATREPDAGELEQMAGLYWDETNNSAYYVVSPRGNRLIVERPGSMQLVFKADKTPGRFVHEAAPQIWIEFLRAEDGSVTAMRYAFGGPVETGPRFTPAKDLPTVEDVIVSVEKFHRIDKLSEIGAVRLSGIVEIETRKMEGPITSLFDATRGRTEVVFGTVEQLAVINGSRAWSGASLAGFEELEGQLKEQALLDQFTVRYGDWTKHYQHVEVLKRIAQGDNNLLLVRVEPEQGSGSTMFVHEESGRLVLMHSLAQLPGMGVVGVKTRFGDYRDVGGMQLPFRSEAKFATPLIGVVNTVFDKVEIGVEVTEQTFAAPKVPDKEEPPE